MQPKHILHIILSTVAVYVEAARTNGNNIMLAERGARLNLLGFRAAGRALLLGLDVDLPFMSMPRKRKVDKYGREEAMVNINSAALITSGLLAGVGVLVAHILRELGLQSRENDETEKKKTAESRNYDTISSIGSILAPFKLVYTNDTGVRAEASLADLLATIEKTFQENDIDLDACLQKSICTLVREASKNVRSDRANGMEKIIDGVSSLSWLLNAIQQTSLRDAIDAGKSTTEEVSISPCRLKYTTCKWKAPGQKLLQLIVSYVKFT